MLRRPVGFDQANVEIETALCDWRAEVDGEGKRIAGTLRMIDQRAQDRGGGYPAERADKRPVIVAGPSLPATVAGGDAGGFVEKMRSSGRQRVAPRCAPCSCNACGKVPRTGTFQISWAYSRMVRSDENHGIRATLRILARVHAGGTCQRASMPRWAS